MGYKAGSLTNKLQKAEAKKTQEFFTDFYIIIICENINIYFWRIIAQRESFPSPPTSPEGYIIYFLDYSYKKIC